MVKTKGDPELVAQDPLKFVLNSVEASPGIEPGCKDLQNAV